MKTFEEWASEPPYELMLHKQGKYQPYPGQYSNYPVQLASEAWDAATIQMQLKLYAQAKEIEALRGFANALLKRRNSMGFYIEDELEKYGLIDEHGNPTKLLMGDK